MVLSPAGVYGLTACLVSEQTGEMGIRRAPGAPRRDVPRMIPRRGTLTTPAGLAEGLPLAYGISRLMASLVYGVSATTRYRSRASRRRRPAPRHGRFRYPRAGP